MIRVEGLTKSYAGIPALRGVDHGQQRGETVVFIGPSGCGKSTFLRCLNRLETPDAGCVTLGDLILDGTRTPSHRETQQLRRRAGMVFQQFHLFPHRTALENILEGPRHVLGLPAAECDSRARALLARVGLSDRAGHYPAQLSGGQQQRVAIARALAMNPDILLLDEPTSALDPELRDEVRTVLTGLAEEGMTMIVVTHDLRLARQVADHVVFLDAGRVEECGPPERIFGSPERERTRDFVRRVLHD
ncbi:MAG: amino acid ABC transporter ATP-binding protein [Verrucomicrobiota bacterium]